MYSLIGQCKFVLMLSFIFSRIVVTRGFSNLGTLSSSHGLRTYINYQRSLQTSNVLTLSMSSSSSQAAEEGSSSSSSSSSSTNSQVQESSTTTSDDDEEEDKLAKFRNKNNRNDQVFSAMSKDGSVKVTACTARNLINEVMMMQTLTAVPADALGRTIVCALLMSNGIQPEQTVQLTLNSDGPLRGVVAISSGTGGVRGYVGSPMLGDIDLEEAVGKGSVQVVKNHPDWPNPYNGITAIRHGDIDRDIGIYLAESEQRSCALAAATAVTGILCKAGGGYLIEQLPGADKETLKKVEENLATLVTKDGGDKLPTNLLLNGITPVDIAEIILDGLDMEPLQQITPKYQCECTSERLVRALRLLPRDEVDDIIAKEEKIEARCEFCGKQYKLEADEIKEKLDNATGDPSKDSDFDG